MITSDLSGFSWRPLRRNHSLTAAEHRERLSRAGAAFAAFMLSVVGELIVVINRNRSDVRQKFGELCSTIKKVMGADVDPPNINTARAV